jgi:hypothetical protein
VPAAALIGIGLFAGLAWQTWSGEAGIDFAAQTPEVSAPPIRSADPPWGAEAGLAGSVAPGRWTGPESAELSDRGRAATGLREGSPQQSEAPVRSAAIQTPAAVRATPLAGTDLATELARSSPAVSTARSLSALLEIWGEAPMATGLMPFSQALATLVERGLAVLPLEGANVQALQHFNYPAILELSALDGMPRFVLLAGLADGEALLAGVDPRGPLRVPVGQLEQHWSGNAWVAWRDFAELPEIMRPPLSGAPVSWLQQALARLGFYSGAPTGEFDSATVEGVRALQASLHVDVDGTVGEVTKARLYERLGFYQVPRLGRLDEETE